MFERRLDAYKKIYDEASAAYAPMKAENPQSIQDKLDVEINMLSELSNQNKILASTDLENLLTNTFIEVSRRKDVITIGDLLQKIAAQMRADLKIDEIDALGQHTSE